jgi:glutamate 5-kinase
MQQLVSQVAEQCVAGKEIVLVTSGAVGAGMGVLGYEKRPSHLKELQACAAVGQSRLMAAYEALFNLHQMHVGQVLLTNRDLTDRNSSINAQNTIRMLLGKGVVPIINENDAISVAGLKFGDNDKLSALAALLLSVDLLVILTTVDGVITNFGRVNPQTIPIVNCIDEELENIARGTTSTTAVGGMKSKIQAAKIVVRSGIPLVIASGKKKRVLANILDGENEGTLFVAQPTKLQGHKRLIAFFHPPKGALFVDDGAKWALCENGKSLLPPGVVRCEGEFAAGDVVRICDLEGAEFARGKVKFNSSAVRERTLPKKELVHRDDLVIL